MTEDDCYHLKRYHYYHLGITMDQMVVEVGCRCAPTFSILANESELCRADRKTDESATEHLAEHRALLLPAFPSAI